jgi:hypothetical protein
MVGRRVALIIAMDQYKSLPKLAAPTRDANTLKEVLENKDIGRYDVKVISNKDHAETIEKISGFCSEGIEPGDLLLIYYSGHGIIDDRKRLYLTAIDTEREKNKLKVNGISSTIIREILHDCRARKKILILDCCFSGAISEEMDKNYYLEKYFPDDFEGERGLCFLTASSEIEPAYEREDGDSEKVSLFTDILVRGLKSGDADANGDYDITIDELFSYIEKEIKNKEKEENRHIQEPMKSVLSARGEIIFATKPKGAISHMSNSPEPILDARINSLIDALKNVGQSKMEWQTYFSKKINILVNQEVWTGLSRAKKNLVSNKLDEIKAIHKKIERANDADNPEDELNQAWLDYLNVYNNTKNIWNEYIEFIGALTIRDVGFQKEIYLWSDELINEDCIKLSLCDDTQHPSPTVPIRPETMIKTVARIIGLHFSELTFWTLPLVAHEFGHVLAEQEDSIIKFVKKLSTFDEHDKICEFFSDAYAVFTMGPAYACSSIYLSLDPDSDIDKERAKVIFRFLNLMNEHSGKNKPFDQIISRLKIDWDNLIARRRSAKALLSGEEDNTMILVEEIWDAFLNSPVGDNLIPSCAQYPANRMSDGWKLASDWSLSFDNWRHESKLPTVFPASRIRDILNSVWLVRLFGKGDGLIKGDEFIREIEQFAFDLYEERNHQREIQKAKESAQDAEKGYFETMPTKTKVRIQKIKSH